MAVQIPQTSVTVSPQVAYAGLVGDGAPVVAASLANANASAEIPFGCMVKRHATSFDLCDVLGATSDKLAGIVIHAQDYQRTNELGSTGIKPKTVMSVLEQGHIWVVCDEAVVPGDAVRVRTSAAGGGLGTFRKSAVAGNSINISTFAQWVDYDSTSGLALLSIDMRQSASAVAD